MSAGSGNTNTTSPPQNPVIVCDQPYKGVNSVYIGPRKIDDSPQASFNYGDGKWVMEFHYIKDGKATERGGTQVSSQTNPQDKGDGKEKLSGGSQSIDSFIAEML